MNDLMNWIMAELFGQLAQIATAVTVLLSIIHLMLYFRDWLGD